MSSTSAGPSPGHDRPPAAGPPREAAPEELRAASVGLDKWPWLRALIASVFVSIWLVCLVWDWFVRSSAVLPGWFQALGVIVLGYLLGVDLVTAIFRGRRA